MVRISVIKKGEKENGKNKGEKKMTDKFNIEGMRVEFEDGLIDKLMQESGIDAVKEITKVLKKESAMKIVDKLAKVNEEMTIKMVDNGFVFEINGRGHDEDWKGAKIIVNTVDELVTLIKEAVELPRD